MEFDELQSAYLKLQDDMKKLIAERDDAVTRAKTIEAQNEILKDNNQKLFERGIFNQQPEKAETPEPQGVEAIKLYIKEIKNGKTTN